MKRITRLTESDLMRIIKRVIKEQEDDDIQTWMDFDKKYPMPSRDETGDVEMDKIMKRLNVASKNPKLRSRLDADSNKTSKIKSLQSQLRELDRERNRIMAELNDLGYND